jgi:hypothetical protein
MAITTTTIKKAAGWARTDAIYQLEEAFTWLGWHADEVTGIVTSIKTYNGGGTIVGSSNTDYYDVFPATTSGIGTGASFSVNRTSGNVVAVYVNRPGYGYTDGEYITLSAEDIGGSVNGAVAIGLTVSVEGGATPVGYGSTNAFYDKQVPAGANYPWGTLRHTIQEGKKFGDTYRVFQMNSNVDIAFWVGSSFHPYDEQSNYDKGHYYPNRLAGNQYFDVPFAFSGFGSLNFSSSVETSTNYAQASDYQHTVALPRVCSSMGYDLDLNIYRSSIDTNFAVLSYKQPTLSSTKLRDNTFLTFIIHNFTSTLWDYDDVFLSGLTAIIPSANDDTPYLEFATWCGGCMDHLSERYVSKRAAEAGYINIVNATGSVPSDAQKSTRYYSNSYPQFSNYNYSSIYLRNNATTSFRGGGGTGGTTDYLPSSSNFNSVIKGIPINTNLIPCPYYLPDDFVLIDFDYPTESANIQQGDTITISGSEVYTVIQGSYNQTDRTRGILFCARKV